MSKILLWLDDSRNPLENDWLVFSPIGRDVDTHWVKSHEEFVRWIECNGLPDGICFDHDLGDYHIDKETKELIHQEKTGMDCAKWLVNFCITQNFKLPKYNIQSGNSVGKENIDCLLKNYIKYCEKI